jgi:hypothetical protein
MIPVTVPQGVISMRNRQAPRTNAEAQSALTYGTYPVLRNKNTAFNGIFLLGTTVIVLWV